MFFGSVKSPAGFHGLQPPKGKQRWLLTNGHGSFTLFLLVDLWRPGWTSLLAYLCGFFCFVLRCACGVWPHNLISLWIGDSSTDFLGSLSDRFFFVFCKKKYVFGSVLTQSKSSLKLTFRYSEQLTLELIPIIGSSCSLYIL